MERKKLSAFVLCFLLALICHEALLAADTIEKRVAPNTQNYTPPKRPVVATPYTCPPDKKTCSCTNALDCFQLGADKVCTGDITPTKDGGGTCTRKVN